MQEFTFDSLGFRRVQQRYGVLRTSIRQLRDAADSVRDSVKDYVRDSVKDSVKDPVWIL